MARCGVSPPASLVGLGGRVSSVPPPSLRQSVRGPYPLQEIGNKRGWVCCPKGHQHHEQTIPPATYVAGAGPLGRTCPLPRGRTPPPRESLTMEVMSTINQMPSVRRQPKRSACSGYPPHSALALRGGSPHPHQFLQPPSHHLGQLMMRSREGGGRCRHHRGWAWPTTSCWTI